MRRAPRPRCRDGMTSLRRLYAISDASFGDPVRLAQALFDGGARLVQVRNKKASARELFNQVESILKRAPADASVIVNDRVDVARITGAAGGGLGPNDNGGGGGPGHFWTGPVHWVFGHQIYATIAPRE